MRQARVAYKNSEDNTKAKSLQFQHAKMTGITVVMLKISKLYNYYYVFATYHPA